MMSCSCCKESRALWELSCSNFEVSGRRIPTRAQSQRPCVCGSGLSRFWPWQLSLSTWTVRAASAESDSRLCCADGRPGRTRKATHQRRGFVAGAAPATRRLPNATRCSIGSECCMSVAAQSAGRRARGDLHSLAPQHTHDCNTLSHSISKGYPKESAVTATRSAAKPHDGQIDLKKKDS